MELLHDDIYHTSPFIIDRIYEIIIFSNKGFKSFVFNILRFQQLKIIEKVL
jgi:hypothetical protein